MATIDETVWRACAYLRRRDVTLFDAPRRKINGEWCMRCPEWDTDMGEKTKRGCRLEGEEMVKAITGPAGRAALAQQGGGG